MQPAKPRKDPLLNPAVFWKINKEDFKLGEYLGKSEYGQHDKIYKGTYKHEIVAIKGYGITLEKMSNAKYASIIQDAKIMQSLSSNFIVGFRGIYVDNNVYLLMEFCAGGALHARLHNLQQSITLADQLRWASQISYGLSHLHSREVVQGDLRGKHILLDKDSNAKLSYFSSSIVLDAVPKPKTEEDDLLVMPDLYFNPPQTRTTTLPWLAPELLESKQGFPAFSKESDVYSLGIVLWEIISRKMPLEGLTVKQMIEAINAGKLDALPTDCPKVFQEMIKACLEIDPKRRPSADEVGTQFQKALTELQSITVSPSKSVPLAEEKSLPLQEQLVRLNAEITILKLLQTKQQEVMMGIEKENIRLRDQLKQVETLSVDKEKKPTSMTSASQNPFSFVQQHSPSPASGSIPEAQKKSELNILQTP